MPFTYILALLFLTSGLLPAHGHLMEPNAPVLDFKLPVFNESGYKAWDLQGHEGLFHTDQTIDVKEMTIQVFSGDEALSLETLIKSPAARINTKTSFAFGEESINITGPNYNISGNSWTWNGDTQQIEIQNNVIVVFNQTHEE